VVISVSVCRLYELETVGNEFEVLALIRNCGLMNSSLNSFYLSSCHD
jgi:hypothetical protein